MGSLKVVKVRLMDPNSILQLLDVFSSPLSKGSLGLSVALFAFFRGGINLYTDSLAWEVLSFEFCEHLNLAVPACARPCVSAPVFPEGPLLL